MATLVTILLVVSIALGGTGATVYAAQDDVPGQALYGVKLLSEDVRLGLAGEPAAQVRLSLEFANRRVAEIEALHASGQTPPQAIATRLQTQLDHALQSAVGMDDATMTRALVQTREMLEQQTQRMTAVHAGAPEQAEPVLAQVQAALAERHALAQMGVNDPQAFRQHVRVQTRQISPGPEHTPGVSPDPGIGISQTVAPGNAFGPGPGVSQTVAPGNAFGPGPGISQTVAPGNAFGPGPGISQTVAPGNGIGDGNSVGGSANGNNGGDGDTGGANGNNGGDAGSGDIGGSANGNNGGDAGSGDIGGSANGNNGGDAGGNGGGDTGGNSDIGGSVNGNNGGDGSGNGGDNGGNGGGDNGGTGGNGGGSGGSGGGSGGGGH